MACQTLFYSCGQIGLILSAIFNKMYEFFKMSRRNPDGRSRVAGAPGSLDPSGRPSPSRDWALADPGFRPFYRCGPPGSGPGFTDSAAGGITWAQGCG